MTVAPAAAGQEVAVATAVPVVIAAHGTADPAGQAVVEAVVACVQQELPQRPVRVGYLDVIGPTVGDALAELDGPAAVVPLLLAPGYHVDVDLPGVAAAAAHPVVCTASLGPDETLVRAALRRLREAGYREGDAIVFGAAGSSSPRSAGAMAQAVRWLEAMTGARVLAAYASATPPTPADAVAQLRAEGAQRVALATYLLAPGFFVDRMHDAGADLVSATIGVADEVVQVVLQRLAAAGC